jgi:hypothetical protein
MTNQLATIDTVPPALRQEIDENGSSYTRLKMNGKDGIWGADGDPIDQAATFAFILSSYKVGEIKFADDKLAELNAGRLADGFRLGYSDVRWDEGFKPYTSCIVVDANGSIFEMSSSQWKARTAFKPLMTAYYDVKRQTAFPVCQLSSRKKKSDPYGNYEPIFTILGWAPREQFPDFAPPLALPPPLPTGNIERPGAVEFKPTKREAAAIIDDDFPENLK